MPSMKCEFMYGVSDDAFIGETGASPPLFQLTASSISIKIARQDCIGLY